MREGGIEKVLFQYLCIHIFEYYKTYKFKIYNKISSVQNPDKYVFSSYKTTWKYGLHDLLENLLKCKLRTQNKRDENFREIVKFQLEQEKSIPTLT